MSDVPDQLVEAGAQALYDLREEGGMRPVVSRWPPSDPDESDDYRIEARAVVAAISEAGWLKEFDEEGARLYSMDEWSAAWRLKHEQVRAQAEVLAEALRASHPSEGICPHRANRGECPACDALRAYSTSKEAA